MSVIVGQLPRPWEPKARQSTDTAATASYNVPGGKLEQAAFGEHADGVPTFQQQLDRVGRPLRGAMV